MDNIHIADESVKYILFQRTDYLRSNPIRTPLRQIGRLPFLYKPAMEIEAILLRRSIKKAFSEDMLQEYNAIKNYLPASASCILDIGCGVAGIDILLSRHYANKAVIFLLDKTTIDERIHYGFGAKGSFYSSLQIARTLLISNGVDPQKIHLQEATPGYDIHGSDKFDLVISLLSLGFHFPVSTYLDQIHDRLKTNGIVILDIRKDTGGEQDIENKFGNAKVICETRKSMKILAKKM
jgi:SAM-dependent methyltransferase